MHDVDPSLGSNILEAVRRLQAAEPTTLGATALTSDVYTEAVVRVLTAKLGEQQPDLGAGAEEVREALSVLKEREAAASTSTANPAMPGAAGEGDEADDVAMGESSGEGGGEGGDEGGGGAVLELARGFGVGALWAELQARRPPSANAEAAPAAAVPVLLLLPASASSVSVALLSLAPRAASEATAHLACFERLVLPHAASLLAGAAGGGGDDGAAEGSGLWRLCGLLLAEQVVAAEQATEAEAALLLQAVGAQWRRLLGTALDAAPPRWLPLLGLLQCVRGCGAAAQWGCAALDALCAKACSDALGGAAPAGAAARAAARRVAVLCLETGALSAASLAHLARLVARALRGRDANARDTCVARVAVGGHLPTVCQTLSSIQSNFIPPSIPELN